MKKALSIIMVLLLGVSLLAGCSSSSSAPLSAPAATSTPASAPAASGGGAETVEEESTSFDYQASGVQQIATSRVDSATLQEAFDWYFGHGFAGGEAAGVLKYDDFVKQIGSEANEYEWHEDNFGKYGVFKWIASDDDSIELTPSFTNGNGTLIACGVKGLKPPV